MDAANEQGLRCPKQECRKLFRKENLLMVSVIEFYSFLQFINLYIFILDAY